MVIIYQFLAIEVYNMAVKLLGSRARSNYLFKHKKNLLIYNTSYANNHQTYKAAISVIILTPHKKINRHS